MRELNLQPRWWDMAKKRRSSRDLRPEFTGPGVSRMITNIPDPRAAVRFSIGDRVAWDDGGPCLHLGMIDSFIEGSDCEVRVRLDDGRLVDIFSIATSLRRIAVPIPGVEVPAPGFDTSVSETVDRHPLDGIRTPPEPTPIGEPLHLSSAAYESMEVLEDEQVTTRTRRDVFEVDVTTPDGTRLTRRGR